MRSDRRRELVIRRPQAEAGPSPSSRGRPATHALTVNVPTNWLAGTTTEETRAWMVKRAFNVGITTARSLIADPDTAGMTLTATFTRRAARAAPLVIVSLTGSIAPARALFPSRRIATPGPPQPRPAP